MKNDNLNITFSIECYNISILKFSHERLPQNMPAHAHSSNSYEIHFIPRGKGTLIADAKTYPVHPGVLFTTGPHIEHAQISNPDDPMYEYCIYLKIERQAKSRGKRPAAPEVMQSFIDYPFWYGTDSTGITDVLEQIRRELSQPGVAAPLMLEALFRQFMVCMLRNYDRTSQSAVAYAPVPVIKAYILIEDSFLYEYDTITLDELSRRLGLSVRQTSRILFSKYGQNFTQMRTEARMAAAAEFLREDRLSISEISVRLGYSCPNHFHTAFKKYYGKTASQYIADIRADGKSHAKAKNTQ